MNTTINKTTLKENNMNNFIDNTDYLNSLIMDLDSLAKRLQDNYNDGKEFKQVEEDRLAVCDAIEYLNEMVFRIENNQVIIKKGVK